MKRIKSKVIAIGLGALVASTSVTLVAPVSVITAEAHSGRTDANGGHKDNKNKSGLGSYHYHCGGHPAHLHTNGVCPYASDSSSGTSAGASGSTSKADKELIKKVQEALNDKGYDCGEADGVAGQKTQDAVKKFQEDNGLTVDGVIGNQVKEALGIS